MLICFIGIDGSGKSTLSNYLYEELKRRNYSVSRTWWQEGEDSLLRRFLRKFRESRYLNWKNASGSYKMDKKSPITEKIFRILYPKIVLFDYFRFGIVKAWLPRLMNRKKVLIFDRFFYDTIIGLSSEFCFSESKKERLLKAFSKLLPKPDLTFILDVPPEVSYLRKMEEIKSFGKAKEIWDDYQSFYPLLNKLTTGKIVRINNSREIELAKAEVLKTSLEFLGVDKNDE